MVRVDTGKTPMKPVRAVRGPPTPISAPSFDAGEQVSPLTEAGGSGGGSGMLRQAAGMIGAALSAAQGTGVAPPTGKSGVHDSANLAAVERFGGDAGVSPDSPTAPAGGSPGLLMRSGSGGMEMDRLMGVLGPVNDQLGRLERRQFESEASIMKQLAS